MSKRKPPSQRPEMKMDETARAIARLREEAKAEKAEKSDQLAAGGSKAKVGIARDVVGPRKAGGAAPPPLTKRQKSG